MDLTGLVMNLHMLKSAQLQEELSLKLIQSATESTNIAKSSATKPTTQIVEEVSLEEGQGIDIRV